MQGGRGFKLDLSKLKIYFRLLISNLVAAILPSLYVLAV